MYNSFFGVKPYCDLGAIGAKGERIGGGKGRNWAGELDRRDRGREGTRGSNTYVLRCRVRVELLFYFFSLKTTKEDLALSTASTDS